MRKIYHALYLAMIVCFIRRLLHKLDDASGAIIRTNLVNRLLKTENGYYIGLIFVDVQNMTGLGTLPIRFLSTKDKIYNDFHQGKCRRKLYDSIVRSLKEIGITIWADKISRMTLFDSNRIAIYHVGYHRHNIGWNEPSFIYSVPGIPNAELKRIVRTVDKAITKAGITGGVSLC